MLIILQTGNFADIYCAGSYTNSMQVKPSFANTYADGYAGKYAKVLQVGMPIVYTAGMRTHFI